MPTCARDMVSIDEPSLSVEMNIQACIDSLDGLTFIALVIFSVGNGIRAPLLAVASSYIDPSAETGRLYTIMSVTDAFSHMIGEPIIQSIWSAALELERHWRMLPFGVTTVRSIFLQRSFDANQ